MRHENPPAGPTPSTFLLLAASLPHPPQTRHLQVVVYDEKYWQSKVIHFSGDCHDSRWEGSGNRRPLIHFYAFMMHVDPLVDARVKRFARDRLRYRDGIFCKASQVLVPVCVCVCVCINLVIQCYSRWSTRGEINGVCHENLSTSFLPHVWMPGRFGCTHDPPSLPVE